MTQPIDWKKIQPVDASTYNFPENFEESLILSIKKADMIENKELIFPNFCPNKKCTIKIFTKVEIENWFMTQCIAKVDISCPHCKTVWLSKKGEFPKELYAMLPYIKRLKIWLLSNEKKNLYLTALIILGMVLLPSSLYFHLTLPKNDPLYAKLFPSLLVFAFGLLVFCFANLLKILEKVISLSKILILLGSMGSIYAFAEEIFRL